MNSSSVARTGLAEWSSRHELISFFALTFVFSWSFYGLLAGTEVPNNTTLSRLLLIAAFGPSISAIVLSSIAAPSATKPNVRGQAALFVLILVVVAGVEWLDHSVWGHAIDSSVVLVDLALVLLASLVAFRCATNNSSERSEQLAGTKQSLPTNWPWYLVALGLWPLLVVAGNVIAGVLAISVAPASTRAGVAVLPLVVESFFWYLLFGGPLNEEPGWRGFALPRLSRQFSPLMASVILGAFWGLWHLPLHLMGLYYRGALGAIIRVQEIPRAVLFTWLYNRTKGSLVVVLLFHAAINTTTLFLPRSFAILFILCCLTAALVIVADKMWRKRPAL